MREGKWERRAEMEENEGEIWVKETKNGNEGVFEEILRKIAEIT